MILYDGKTDQPEYVHWIFYEKRKNSTTFRLRTKVGRYQGYHEEEEIP